MLQFGGEGAENGQFNYPYAIAVDKSANIYVSDTNNHRIQKFNSNGQFISKWGTLGSADGQFNMPYKLAFDRYNNLYVADCENNRIQRFSASGVFQAKWGSFGATDGCMYSVQGIAIGYSGKIYIADTGNDRVQHFTPTTITLQSFTHSDLYQQIKLSWTTTMEWNNTGFHVWRRRSGDSDYVRVTSSIIPSQGTPSSGASYTWTDPNVIPEDIPGYLYKIEIVGYDDYRKLYGPAQK